MTAEIPVRPCPEASAVDPPCESEQHLQVVVDHLDAIVWEADPEQLQPTFVNRRAATILGYPIAQWLAEPIWLRLLHPEDCDRVLAQWRAAPADGSSVACVHRCVAANGQPRWFCTSLHRAAGLRADGSVQGLTFDITPYYHAEHELCDNEHRYRLIIEHSTDMIARVALDGRYLYVSSACRTLLGYTSDELIGRSAYDLAHPEDVPAMLQSHAALLECLAPCTLECRLRHKDGSYRWFETTCQAFRESETAPILEIFAASRDITERKRAYEERAQLFMREQRAQAEAEVSRKTDRLKSDLIANVSHELRTPLHHIKGYAAALLQPRVERDDATVQEFLRIITEESDKLERLIVDLLDTSRIETGGFSLNIESVQLDEVTRSVIERWQGIEAHTFGLRLPDYVPPVAADPHRIAQVLDNLLANVVWHTPSHTLAIVSIDVNREQLLVSVADHGPGIRAEHLPYLFDRFYQANAETDRRRRGSGLGLFICKGIIEQHGGSIWVETVPEGGATFRFALPRRYSLAKDPRTPGAEQPHGQAS